MALLHIPLDQIQERHLQGLIDSKVAETRDIEYKRQSYGKSDKDHGEFLADISSFANTSGGDIVIGMDAQAGIARAFQPMPLDTADGEKLRLESIARSGLQPRVFGLDFQLVRVITGAALVIRIPPSYNSPHRIIRQGSGNHRFFARSSAGKYELNVDELRGLFTRAPQMAERIRDFRLERVAKIVAGDTPARLQEQNAIIIHVVPFSAFDKPIALPLTDVYNLYSQFPPLGGSANQFRINIDGLLTLSNSKRDATTQRAYVQVFRSGIVEAVSSILVGDGTSDNPLRATSLQSERYIARWTHEYVSRLINLGCDPPFVVLVSLAGVRGIPYRFTPISGYVADYDQEAGLFDRDQLHFTGVIIEALPPDPYEYAKLLRPLFDEIANAAGRHSTVSFDQAGAFKYKL